MAWFQCFIRGENFPGQLVGEAGQIGFYVTRFVEAAEPDAAEAAALQGLRSEPKFVPSAGFTPNGQARVVIEEIAQVAAGQVPSIKPGPLEDADAEPGAAPDRRA
jgi:hypothetical protein